MQHLATSTSLCGMSDKKQSGMQHKPACVVCSWHAVPEGSLASVHAMGAALQKLQRLWLALACTVILPVRQPSSAEHNWDMQVVRQCKGDSVAVIGDGKLGLLVAQVLVKQSGVRASSTWLVLIPAVLVH